MRNQLYIASSVIVCVLLGDCSSSKKLITNIQPTQEEINNSDLYYDVVNLVLDHFYIEKSYPFYDIDGEQKILLHHKAEVQTWNCFLYQKKNFFYYHSYIDTLSEPILNVGIRKERLRNLCKAVKSSFLLSSDSNKYKHKIAFSDKEISEYPNYRGPDTKFFSPVIDRADGYYVIYFSNMDFEGGVGHIVELLYDHNGFRINNISRDPQDHFGCWHKEDYVIKMCR